MQISGIVSTIGEDIPFELPKGWSWYKWKDLILEYDQGLIRSNLDLVEEGTFYFKMHNMNTDGYCDYSKKEYTRASDSELSQYKLENGDFLINVRNTLELVGKTCVVSELNEQTVYNHMIIKVTHCDRRLNYYINALFSKTNWKKYIDGCKKGTTTVIALYKDDLLEIPIPIPDEKTFDSIVRFEKDIIDLISINNKINAELEMMTKMLYEHWFLQFDFPDDSNRPYKSSKGKMIYNDVANRNIPYGWEVVHLKDIATYSEDRIKNTEIDDSSYIGTDNLLAEMKGRKKSEYVPSEGQSTRYQEGDTLIANIRPYFKKIWFADKTGGCSSDVLCIRPKDTMLKEFVYSTLARNDFFVYDMAGAKGSKMPRGDKDHIMAYPVMFHEEIAKAYSKIVRDAFYMIEKNYQKNQEMIMLRDFIIPMIINRQIKCG